MPSLVGRGTAFARRRGANRETFDVFTGSIARRYFGYARGDFEVSRIGLEVWVQKPPKFPTSVIFAWLCVIIYSSIY